MKTPSVVIFCRNISVEKAPFNTDYYWSAYMDLLIELKRQGAEAYFATGNHNYAKNGIFLEAFTANNKVNLTDLRPMYNIRADVIYDKGGFTGNDCRVLNPKFVYNIASDKLQTYRHFGHLQPKSILCNSAKQLEKAISTLNSKRVVVKKLKSNGGRGVIIANKGEVMRLLNPIKYPLLVQEFIDTSIGIPDLCKGVHDLRIEIGGGNIWGGLLRTPRSGELRANVAQGGTERHLSTSELPASARDLAMNIDKFFANYDRHYAIDLANTSSGWKLIELNSKPGLSPADISPQAKEITKQLSKYLVSISRKK